MLGYVADSPISVAEVLGEQALDKFTALTAVHGDGWGMAWQEPGDGTHALASPTTATLDPTYAELTHRARGAAGMLHLRWATGGLPVSPENTHPFHDDNYAFAHNGHISPIARLETLLNGESRAQLKGDTDSERYFRFVLQSIASTGSEPEGVAVALGVLMDEFPDCSLNALMLTPSYLFAVHVNTNALAPTRALRELFATESEIPPRHQTEYFAMDYRVTPDAVHVISSGLDEDGWTPISENTVAMIDLQTRQVSRLDPVRRAHRRG
ncbi:class II glutamine amidotransferase [Nocardioides sp.]|uniref:class II glutamine amidotransferase n=1 Tax=Nocardioides sp. TaxID=35761 RepID=UPI00273511AE|nr:class II glutamine amidotransferase [Nocardioides sp.]MDP3889641.1 class II glutamine amidotransferase [Nocardioides sp.]